MNFTLRRHLSVRSCTFMWQKFKTRQITGANPKQKCFCPTHQTSQPILPYFEGRQRGARLQVNHEVPVVPRMQQDALLVRHQSIVSPSVCVECNNNTHARATKREGLEWQTHGVCVLRGG